MTPRRWGLVVALLVLVADQASKDWLLGLMRANPQGIEVTPFFNLVMVWNRGVSFGLFNSGDNDLQRWILIAVTTAISLGLAVWLYRAATVYLTVALGLVVGGAAGNIVDRIRLGAVADFFDVHAFGWHWPAFNIADAGIVVGVVLLVAEQLFARPPVKG
jgi:signal peptidase II